MGTYIDKLLFSLVVSPASLVLEDHVVIPPAPSGQFGFPAGGIDHLPALDVEVGLRVQEGIPQGNVLFAFSLFCRHLLSLLCLLSAMWETPVVKA